MQPLRLAMIGSRGHYGYVFSALPRLSGIELVAVSSGCGDSVEPLLREAAKVGVAPAVFDDYRKMLDEVKPDLVSIDGPFEEHAAMCIEALRRRIHVFCEKPAALTLEDLARLRDVYDEVRDKGVELVSMVGLRAEAPFLTAYRAFVAGAVGKVKMINARKSYKLGNRPEFYRHRDSYGGTIPWVGSHAIDWIGWFAGGGKFKTVYALHDTADNKEHGDLENTALVVFTLDNGVMASASIDYLRPMAAPTHGDDRVRVAGTEGVIEVTAGKVKLIDKEGERELELLPDRGIFFDFAEHLVKGTPALTNADETFALTEACLLARQSADCGQVLRFPESKQ